MNQGLKTFVRVATELAIVGNAEPRKIDDEIFCAAFAVGSRELTITWRPGTCSNYERGLFEAILWGVDEEVELHIPWATPSEIREIVLRHLAN